MVPMSSAVTIPACSRVSREARKWAPICMAARSLPSATPLSSCPPPGTHSGSGASGRSASSASGSCCGPRCAPSAGTAGPRRTSSSSPRWASLLEVYDNIIGDQFLKPLIDVIPGADLLQLHDLPYMFLLMVGVALVRKPGCVTAMVFINFLLAQLLFGSGHGALDWTDGLTQGIFCDLYIVARRGRVYAPGSSAFSMVLDGLMIGALRGGPNAFLTDWTFDPYLNSIYYTWYQMWRDTWSNALGNGVEAAISAALALRVARCGRALARRQAAQDGLPAADPFAEPAAGRYAAQQGLRPSSAARRRAGMKRIAIISSVTTVVLLIFGPDRLADQLQLGPGRPGPAVRQPARPAQRRRHGADRRRTSWPSDRRSCGSWRCGRTAAIRPAAELRRQDVSFAYLGASGRRAAARQLAAWRRARWCWSPGLSGCGKSTLALALCGLIPSRVHGELRGAGHVRRQAAERAAAARGVPARRHGVPEPEPPADQPDGAIRGGVRAGEPGPAAARDRRPGGLVPGRDRDGRAAACGHGHAVRRPEAAHRDRGHAGHAARGSSCWTSRCPTWTRSARRRCSARCGGWPRDERHRHRHHRAPGRRGRAVGRPGRAHGRRPGPCSISRRAQAWDDETRWLATGVGVPGPGPAGARAAGRLPGRRAAVGGRGRVEAGRWLAPALARPLRARGSRGAPPGRQPAAAGPAGRRCSSGITSASTSAPSGPWMTCRSRSAQGEWVAMIGANGSGKSTLTGLSVGMSTADHGSGAASAASPSGPGKVFEHAAQRGAAAAGRRRDAVRGDGLGELEFGTRFRALPPDPVLDVDGAIEFFGFRGPRAGQSRGS